MANTRPKFGKAFAGCGLGAVKSPARLKKPWWYGDRTALKMALDSAKGASAKKRVTRVKLKFLEE
jgi:hypothetical protein